MDASDYVTALCNSANRATIESGLIWIGVPTTDAARKVDRLFEVLDDIAQENPKFTARIEPFFTTYLEKIIRAYGDEHGNASVKRRSRETPEWLRGRRRISSRSHYISDLALALLFRHEDRFDYSAPAVTQNFAFTFLARVLITLGLENPTVRTSTAFKKAEIGKQTAEKDGAYEVSERLDLDLIAEILRTKKLVEILTQRFRDWNCRQLPNLPTGAYSSVPGRSFTDNPAEIRQSQIRLDNDIRKVNAARPSRNH